MKGYVYILRCSNGKFYTGSTTDIEQRLKEHHAGTGANYTRKHLPVELVYVQECGSVEAAFRLEKQIHGWSHGKKEALIKGDFAALKRLSENRCGPSTGSGTENENIV